MFHGIVCLGRRLIAADQRFQLQMADRGVQNRLRHQRCPGVVEMQDVPTSRCLPTARCTSIAMIVPLIDP